MPAESHPGPNGLATDKWNGPVQADGQSGAVDFEAGKQRADLHELQPVNCRILIVDADVNSRRQISLTLSDLGHELTEVASTTDALVAMSDHSADLVMVDAHVPPIGGIAFCQVLRNAAATRLIPIFMLATQADGELEAQAIVAGADEFFVPPFNQSALRARVDATLRLKKMMESLDNSEAVLFSLARSVEDRDPDLGEHCHRLALMASAMGVALGLAPDAITSLLQGGYLHDIGKIGIPDRVLFKAGPLSPDEWEIMRSHSTRGERICACMKSLAPVLPIIRNHHEKFDGSGYPDGLKGEEIPLLARIVQVVDIYDALTTERPYKRAYTPDEALAIMREETQKGWRDPLLVEVFADVLPMFRLHSPGESVRLSLQRLADSLEHYRRTSLRQPLSA